MAALHLYLDLMSQPCRSVYIFARANNIAFQYEAVRLFKGEHITDEFKNVNAFRKVPALKDGEFTLSESTAIILYLARKFNTPDHWYPSDLQKRARVDEYLAWQHTNTRPHGSKIFWGKHMAKVLTGEELCPEKLNPLLVQFSNILTDLEKVFLQDTPFLVGDEISIADLVAIVELMQAVAAGLNFFDDRPKLDAWKQRVVAAIGEELFNEAHKEILSVQEHSKDSIPPQLLEGLKEKLELITK
ncbi:glutathione S-transferase theta-3-like [Pelobates fuscus]|uniref:glutathione S-transferase theta-3-like n=1 Tax=Pelobates fuscus TaxID=191477 RepID=UPI002FE4DE67